ncbi:MAG: hypothetical protein AAFX99_01285, partial [Myxococcota bacterium]
MYNLSKRRKLRCFNTTTPAELKSLQTKHKSADALFYAYHALIIEALNAPVEALWDTMTKSQQVVATIGLFAFQVGNGGVWQFLFNRPEFCVAAAEA